MVGEHSTHGTLPTGARYRVDWPAEWNGTLLLYSRPIPVAENDPPWPDGDPFIRDYLDAGYALAGSANTIFWPLELAFNSFEALVAAATAAIGPADRRVGFGLSIGGIVTAGIVQRFPGLLSGALPLCGNVAGGIAIHNRELDIAFVVKTLLAPDSGLELVRIRDASANLERAREVLAAAKQTPAGRARLALAAAVGHIPAWYDGAAAEPPADDIELRAANQVAWFEEPGFLVYFWAREQVERQAGGNPSWNTDSDYRRLLETSDSRDIAEGLYHAAGLSLADDLAVLADAPRIEADEPAVEYLEDHIVIDGELGGIPVLTIHSDGDGLVTPDNEHAYGEIVQEAGNGHLLRQLYLHRGGHCTFTAAEMLTALDALAERMNGGSWPDLSPAVLNAAVARHEPKLRRLRSGEPVEGSFFDYAPPPFPRPYDARHVARRRAARPAGGTR